MVGAGSQDNLRGVFHHRSQPPKCVPFSRQKSLNVLKIRHRLWPAQLNATFTWSPSVPLMGKPVTQSIEVEDYVDD